jgi:alcohol dehydrogenase (cytochrome c)
MTHTIDKILLFMAAAGCCLLAGAGEGPTQEELRSAASSTDWVLPNHSYASQRHVDLEQINRDNVANLRLVCSYDFEDTNRSSAAPLVYRGIMYVTSGDATVALDAATCEVRWRHDWRVKGWPAQAGSRNVTNAFKSGGGSLQDGKLVRATSDSHLIALDAQTGQLMWERLVAAAGKYEFVTMAPLIYEDVVIAGIGISEFAVKGWIGAFRLADGEPVWRFNTVPDDDEPGAQTWSDPQARRRGGGGVWVTPAIDQETGLLYVAVGNPAPDLYGDVREGTNLYTGSLIVLDARTGKLQWYKQFVPHDVHDWDMTAAGPIYRVATQSETRAMVAVGSKDGLLRGLDRDAQEQVFEVSVTTRVDPDVAPTVQGVHVCPGILGGMQWSLPAFNPGLNLLFAPAVDWCGHYWKSDNLRYIQGQLYLGGFFTFDPVESSRGWLTAVDAASGMVKWKYQSPKPMLAAVTTTSSELVFTGELTGHLLVLDGRDGAVLYRFDIGVPVSAGVITYAVDGKQYVALATGATTAFWRAARASSRVSVFSLPARSTTQ